MLELRMFGGAEVRIAAELVPTPPPKELALLAFLSLQASPVPRNTLLSLLWPAGGKGGLRVTLSRLRHLPGSQDWLATDGPLVAVRAESDVVRFENALKAGKTTEALSAWPEESGSLLAGLEVRNAEPFLEWLHLERSRLDALRADARRIRMAELERMGRLDEALTVARGLLGSDPLDEAAHRAVMRIEHERGNTESALVQFERLRIQLRDELELDPSPETLAELARVEGHGVTAAERALVLARGDEVPSRATWVVGREEQLDAAECALKTSGRVLIHGAGGMGKSTVAAELAAHRLQSGGLVAWVRCGRGSPGSVFDALAAALDARAELAQAASQTVALRHVLAADGIRLVVLDDALNAFTLARVSEALPENCELVVTSRHRYPGLQRVRLGRLGREQARELLEFHAGRAVRDVDADTLCALLGDHPFAVRIAGVVLANAEQSVAHLASRVREAPHALAMPADLAEPGRESVAALLEVNLEELRDDAYEALMGIGALSVPAATPELLAELLHRDVGATEDALSTLQARALAERIAEAGSDVIRYRVHDLTQSLARANTHVRHSSVRQACLRFLQGHHTEHDLLDAELGQIVAAVRETLEAGDPADAVGAMVRLCEHGGYFNGRGHTPSSLALLERVASVAEEFDVSAAQTLHVKLGNGQRELLGNLDRARESYGRAAELARSIKDTSREVIALSAMGGIEVALGNEAGESTVVSALQLAREIENDLALAHALQNLSYVAGVKGRLREAATLSEEAVEAADRLGADVHPDEAHRKQFFARFNLGVARWHGGDTGGGRVALEDALAVARQRANPTWRAYALQELADLEEAAGRHEVALEKARAALDLYDRHRMRRDAQTLRSWLAEHADVG